MKSKTVRLDDDVIKDLDKIGQQLKQEGIKNPSYSQIIHYVMHSPKKR